MRLLYISLLAAINCTVACAQATSGRVPGNATGLDYIGQQLQAGKSARTVPGIKGTPFLFSHWAKGNVLTTNGLVKAVWLKYNLANNELLWRRPSGDSLSLNVIQIKEFNLGDSLRGEFATFRRYPVGVLPIPFFEVLYDNGKSAFLRYRIKETANLSSGGTSLMEARPPSWQTTTQYFILKGPNAVPVLVRLNKKSLIEALGANQNTVIITYIEHEHLSLKKEDDVKKLLAYYDTL